MKYWLILASVIVGGMCLSGPQTFAAYGGWGGWSSISTSSFLKKDVCRDGDTSASYYDGTCEWVVHESAIKKAEETVIEKKDTGEEKKAIPEIFSLVPVSIDPQRVIERKNELEEKIAKNNIAVLNMPIIYRPTQIKIETIMSRWDGLDQELKDKKAIILIDKIDTLLETKKLPEKLRIIVQYIQDKAVLMTSL